MPIHTGNINSHWLFHHGIDPASLESRFDDSKWRQLNLPHDWSIEGTFSPDEEGYCRSAYLPSGQGTYRKHFTIPEEFQDCRVILHFGGVYKNAEVFVNGKKAGGRPWGYIPFEFDITDLVNLRGENVICVTVDNSALPGARWYSGTGIYRDVCLKFHKEIHFPTWRIHVTSSFAPEGSVSLNVRYHIKNTLKRRIMCRTVHKVFNPDGHQVADSEKTHVIGAGLEIFLDDHIPVSSPELWDVEHPNLYTLQSEIHYQEKLEDSAVTRFGIRNMVCDPDKGFLLNGRAIKIKGACLHNDGGALGAACPKKTFTRQLEILKTMGCNAVRTAHHPFSEDFLDACDELGVLVLAEAFDEWQEPIRVMPFSDGEPQSLHVNYYAKHFDEWAVRDLSDMILRDRNHPSIFMWSIGNEIPQMYKPSGFYIAEKLVETVGNLDARPVTCAAVCWKLSDKNIRLLSVAGFNYPKSQLLDDFKQRHPDMPILITEDYSAQTRRPLGKYYPADTLPDMGYTYRASDRFIREHERMQPGIMAWEQIEQRPFVMGGFIWTGFDYLGEPTPYDYPAHTSFFGVIDTCGIPKDGYYYYRSKWTSEPVVHIASSWDFNDGDLIEIPVISNCCRVELFLNDISCGEQKGNLCTWRLPFRKGKLTAVGVTADEIRVCHSISTQREPSVIHLNPYSKNPLKAGEIDYILCRVTDFEGFALRKSETIITFEVSGAGELLAVDNGNQMSLDPFRNNNRIHLCDGKCLCILRATRGHAPIKVTAHSDELDLKTEIILPVEYEGNIDTITKPL